MRHRIFGATLSLAAISYFIEPSSKSKIPKERQSNNSIFTLLGSGIRNVSFLGISVYVASIYVDGSILSQLKHSNSWSNFTKKQFLEPSELPNFYARDLCDRMSGSILLAIQPVRNTNGTHMKIGFLKYLEERFKVEQDLFSPSELISVRSSIDSFGKEFPLSVIKSGSMLLFEKDNDNLKFLLDGKLVFEIKGKWLASNFIKGYLENTKPPSPQLRESFGEFVEEFLKQ